MEISIAKIYKKNIGNFNFFIQYRLGAYRGKIYIYIEREG
jgi:hypothetical protein